MEWHIYVAGAGILGLASAACYAQEGNFVSLYEKDISKRKAIASGRLPVHEPNLDQLLRDAMSTGRLELVADPNIAVEESDISLVAVGTPNRNDGSMDSQYVVAACRDFGRGLKRASGYKLLSIRSTVFPGTTTGLLRKTVEKLSGKRAGSEFGLVAYPEFVRGGSAIQDMLHPDRIVIGELDDRSGETMESFVREFHSGNMPPLLRVNATTAEMIKYASNAFIATKIAFMNEIASLCGRFEDVDARRVADGMGHDPRIGRALLDAGVSFGGGCLPKDLRELIAGAKKREVRLRIAEATLTSNEAHSLEMLRLARELLGDLRGKHAAVLGLVFKARTNDMREAPSIKIVRALLRAGMSVNVYDPAVGQEIAVLFDKKVKYADDIRDCLEGAECCFIVTGWDEFKAIPQDLFIDHMSQPNIIDGCRVFDPSKLNPAISYRAIGLGVSRHHKSNGQRRPS